ncbi:MAG: hypothetical protein JW963_08585 [Anaerolineales bacterium]|nr:hypothetical protein [Anaerolineales bacterium]
MKIFHAIIAFLIGLVTSYFLVATFFTHSDYTSTTDRLFLTLMPALAIGLLLFESFSPVSKWIKRVVAGYSLLRYLLGFLLSLSLAYGAVGFLSGPLRTSFSLVLFTTVFMTIGNVFGYYLLRRAGRAFRDGFLSGPLNVILALSLPLFLFAIVYVCVQFPAMFVWDYIRVPQEWIALFLVTALAAGVWSLRILEKFELSGYHKRFRQTNFFHFISKNLPGLYAGGMFFLVNLILARTLNQPALSYNSVLFEADAGPWMEILAGPEVTEGLRSVHPLSLIIIRPLMRTLAVLMGEHWDLAGMLVVAAMSGLCVFMAWLYLKRAIESSTYAFIFAILLGSTATHLVFGSLTENYIFGAAALIFFFLLIQAGEKRFSVLLPSGLLLLGITISNIAQGVIALFFNKFGFYRLVRYCLLVLGAGVILTFFTGILYPNIARLFFVPSDIAFEFNFVKFDDRPLGEHLLEKFQVVSRTMFLYDVAGPSLVEAISNKPPYPTIDIFTFDQRTHSIASYKGLADIPLILWLILLGGAFLVFIKNIRSSEHRLLIFGLLGALGFNFLLHMAYGTELFLYTPYWVYALVFFVALAWAEFAQRKWFDILLTIILFTLMVNNIGFVFSLLRSLAPFYAAV